MYQHNLNRVEFYSKEDMAEQYHLSNGEHILRSEIKPSYTDINDVIEFYNIKKYIDNGLFLKSWTQDDIDDFKQKVTEYGKIIGSFFSTIFDANIIGLHGQLIHGYVHSFWEIVNNHNIYKRISRSIFCKILENEPYLIHELLTHKGLVNYYDAELKNFLLTYLQSAEILLNFYEKESEHLRNSKFIP